MFIFSSKKNVLKPHYNIFAFTTDGLYLKKKVLRERKKKEIKS